jgi:hypothetical protein
MNAEQTTFHELTSPQTLRFLIEEKARDMDILHMFALPPEVIRENLSIVEFYQGDLSFDPGYQSPGYGKAIDHPLVKFSTIIPMGKDQLRHELNHALHEIVCKYIFEGSDWHESVTKFSDTVLGDKDFISFIQERGSDAQKTLIAVASDLIKLTDLSQDTVQRFSWIFGALTYQHAYFVDPGMIEAVGSYKNTGAFLKGTLELNHYFGRFFIPGEDAMEGYMDTKAQALFAGASREQKALFVRKADYNREQFFASK